MAHEYPTLTKLIGRWLARQEKGPRLDGDLYCAPVFAGADEAIFWRDGFNNPSLLPAVWRRTWGESDVFFIRKRGDTRFYHVHGLVEGHARLTGGRVVYFNLAALGAVVGISRDSFRPTDFADLKLVHQVVNEHNFGHTLIDFRGTRVLIGDDPLYRTEFYVEVSADIVSVTDAVLSLTPPAVIEAQRQGLPYFRHGNWFLVRRAAEIGPDALDKMAKEFALPEHAGRESAHFVSRGYEEGGRYWVHGMLKHSRFHRFMLDGLWEAIASQATNRATG